MVAFDLGRRHVVCVPNTPVATATQSAAMAAKQATSTSTPTTPAGNTDMAARNAAMAVIDAIGTNQGEDHVIGHPTRIVQPNCRFVGPEW